MIPMKPVADESEAFQAILRIVRDQRALERHQRSRKASPETLQDSMVYAYSEILEVLHRFLDEQS